MSESDPHFASLLDTLSLRYLEPVEGSMMGNDLVATVIGIAEQFDGTYELEPKTPHPPGTVY